jgi:hypothetical protein
MIEVKLTFATFGEAAEALARMGGSGWAPMVLSSPPDLPADYVALKPGEPVEASVGTGGAGAYTPNAEPEAPARKRGRPAKVADPATQTVPVDESEVKATSIAEAAPQPEPAPATEPKREPTAEELTAFQNRKRSAISAVMEKVGQDAAKRHLDRFRDGIRKLSDVTWDEAEAFYAWCENDAEITKSKDAV